MSSVNHIPRVLVVGAGIAGLAADGAIGEPGWQVSVAGQDPDGRNWVGPDRAGACLVSCS